MDYPKGCFRYIDKDKIIPKLQERANELRIAAVREPSMERRMLLLDLAQENQYTIDMIEEGMFDWQMGSE